MKQEIPVPWQHYSLIFTEQSGFVQFNSLIFGMVYFFVSIVKSWTMMLNLDF